MLQIVLMLRDHSNPSVAFSEYTKPDTHEKFQNSSECLCLSLLNWCVNEIQNELGKLGKLDSEGRVCHIEKSSVSPQRNVVHWARASGKGNPAPKLPQSNEVPVSMRTSIL